MYFWWTFREYYRFFEEDNFSTVVIIIENNDVKKSSYCHDNYNNHHRSFWMITDNVTITISSASITGTRTNFPICFLWYNYLRYFWHSLSYLYPYCYHVLVFLLSMYKSFLFVFCLYPSYKFTILSSAKGTALQVKWKIIPKDMENMKMKVFHITAEWKVLNKTDIAWPFKFMLLLIIILITFVIIINVSHLI